MFLILEPYDNIKEQSSLISSKLDEEYALKIQHVLEKDIKKNYNNEIWCELSLYKYIDTLTKEEQLFFTKYDCSICKCEHEHKQKRYDIKSHSS